MSAQAKTNEVEIHDLSHDGRGVARIDGKTVFVTGALPGERVRLCIEQRHPRFDEARLVEVLQAAPERRTPPCPYHGRCGGCTLQHLDPAAQLASKQRQLEQTLRRLGKLQPKRWLDAVSSTPWGYRSRARLAVTHDAHSGRISLGLRRERSHHVEALEECAILEPRLARLLQPLARCLEQFEQPALAREALLAAGDAQLGLALVFTATPGTADRARLQAFVTGEGIALRLGVFRGNGSHAWEAAAPALAYAPAEGLSLAFDPWHFTQANRAVNRALVASVIAQLEPRPVDRALELFCGLGNFTLPLARVVAAVSGIDGDADLTGRARANAAANNCSNASFHVDDLSRPPDRADWASARWDLVLLDPPRSGALALCDTLVRSGARRIAYVSCDPATLARDAARLVALGLRLEAAGVLDMFPHTAHFESLAVFRR